MPASGRRAGQSRLAPPEPELSSRAPKAARRTPRTPRGPPGLTDSALLMLCLHDVYLARVMRRRAASHTPAHERRRHAASHTPCALAAGGGLGCQPLTLPPALCRGDNTCSLSLSTQLASFMTRPARAAQAPPQGAEDGLMRRLTAAAITTDHVVHRVAKSFFC